MRSAIIRLVPLLLALPLAGACGFNAFELTESPDAAEDATLALERRDESKAISILEKALADDPDDPVLLSILATAHAQRAGIELLDFVKRIAQNDGGDGDGGSSGGSSGGGSGFTGMFRLMPEATPGALSDIQRACSILINDIAPEARTSSDLFKLALYQTASMIMHTKALDTDGDGRLSVDEVLELSDASAAALLSQLAQANGLLASGGDQKSGQSVSRFQQQIDAAPGATQEERLRNYLAGTR